jgi:type IV pilus assembly protein PilN
MIRINLLPYRAARKKENIRIQVNIFLGSVIIAILLVWLYNSHLNGSIEHLNADIASTKAQVEKFKEINAEIADIKKKLALLDRKIKVIESLEAERNAPVQNLDAFYNLLVEKRMWYNQIDETGNNIKISGIALDNQTVADYMTRVEKSDRFADVKLASIKQYALKGKDLKLKQFDISFRTKPMKNEAAEGKK